jgi:hypothetical protein
MTEFIVALEKAVAEQFQERRRFCDCQNTAEAAQQALINKLNTMGTLLPMGIKCDWQLVLFF